MNKSWEKSSTLLGNVTEVQSLIDKGVQLNYEYLGENEKPSSYPLHDAIKRHLFGSTFDLFQYWMSFDEYHI